MRAVRLSRKSDSLFTCSFFSLLFCRPPFSYFQLLFMRFVRHSGIFISLETCCRRCSVYLQNRQTSPLGARTYFAYRFASALRILSIGLWDAKAGRNVPWHRMFIQQRGRKDKTENIESLPAVKRLKIIFEKGRNEKMTTLKKNLRTCSKGHEYYKSSDCPVCPICEQQRKPDNGFLSLLSAPARRALEHNGISSLQHLAKYSEKEILKFHGMGPASLPKLRVALKEKGLSFKS